MSSFSYRNNGPKVLINNYSTKGIRPDDASKVIECLRDTSKLEDVSSEYTKRKVRAVSDDAKVLVVDSKGTVFRYSWWEVPKDIDLSWDVLRLLCQGKGFMINNIKQNT